MSNSTKQPRIWTRMVISGAIVFVVWIVYPYVIERLYPDLGHRGQFGDLFGALNALFAGLAFAGIIWAIILQKNELELQREELEQTRKEIKGQKEQLEAQDQTLKRQNFENSFFQLLSFHSGIVDSFQMKGQRVSIDGRLCFGRFQDDLSRLYKSEPDKDIDIVWQHFFESYQSMVGHYFRHLYNTVKFVDRHDFLDEFEQRKSYTNLLRAQLSSHELGILFYNCLSHRGAKFKSLVEKYSLLENLDKGLLLNEEHMSLYEKTAFGQSEGG